VDTQKLGLWPGGFLRVQGLSSFGQNINNATGAIISPNFISLLPEPEHSTTGLMNLTFMQFLSKHFGVFLSKVSGLGADDNAFAHGYHTTFLNSGLDLNMTLALFPLTACGGSLVILSWDGAVVTVAALDPSETATDNDIGDAFEDGVLVFALLVPTQPPNRVGYTWSVYYNFDQYL
jgi:porin